MEKKAFFSSLISTNTKKGFIFTTGDFFSSSIWIRGNGLRRKKKNGIISTSRLRSSEKCVSLSLSLSLSLSYAFFCGSDIRRTISKRSRSWKKERWKEKSAPHIHNGSQLWLARFASRRGMSCEISKRGFVASWLRFSYLPNNSFQWRFFKSSPWLFCK